MFFIDAASFIDMDDDSWRFFLLFEKVYKQHNKSGHDSISSNRLEVSKVEDDLTQ